MVADFYPSAFETLHEGRGFVCHSKSDWKNALESLILSKFEGDTFEKEAGGVSFGGHGANPELFNIRYGKKRRKKDGERN